MGQYCDSALLERNWFHWLLSSDGPALERYRELGILWTKVVGRAKDDKGQIIIKKGRSLPDPCHPVRSHCVALPVPIYFNSYQGKPPETARAMIDGTRRTIRLTELDDELNLQSDHWIHRLGSPVTCDVESLQRNGYVKEIPTTDSWHAILEDVNKMCLGIATRFNPPNEEDLQELAHEAVIQVIRKLADKKLVYTPGRAPVFNLLTTAIFRCMYSIQNRRKNRRVGWHRLVEQMQAGVLPDNVRSFRAGAVARSSAKAVH